MKILRHFSWLLAVLLQFQSVVALPGYTNLNHFRRAAAASQIVCSTSEKAVFAHFMIGNVPNWQSPDWEADMQIAISAHIDAFVLNMAFTDENLDLVVAYAFAAARKVSFKLFFSFDYAASNWLKADVLRFIQQYKDHPAYFQFNGKPLVSTFEGVGNADEWTDIKSQTGVFFLPDYSSLGAKAAMDLGVADGLFSWAAWPWGDQDMNTYVDASYNQFLGGKPYMMPVSPWFYTNLPQYDKNWLWRGDDLWYDRWEEVMFWQPDLVEIISWNDYGESHYVGPIHETTLGALASAPFDYVSGMDHEAWLMLLPFIIGMYKYGTSPVYQEGVQAWYRLNPNSAGCSTGGTTGNTASQLLIEFPPNKVVQDKVFFSALLASDAEVYVTINGVDTGAEWTHKPYGFLGIYHGSVDINGEGPVTIMIKRNGGVVCSATGKGNISSQCVNGLSNYNAYVMGGYGEVSTAQPKQLNCQLNCTGGWGAGDFAPLCEYSCGLGYCPKGACYCTKMGKAVLPKPTGAVGYPIAGADANYEGLCNFACVYGYCPSEHCGTVSGLPMATPTVSPFTPPACVKGSGVGLLEGLCSFACNFGYCPIAACTCTVQGPLNLPPKVDTSVLAGPANGLDLHTYGILCVFACQRGWCPSDVCETVSSGSGDVYIDQSIFTAEPAQVQAQLPALLIPPPSTYPGVTVFSYPPVTTTLVLGSGSNLVVYSTVLTPEPSTGSVVSFFNIGPIVTGLSTGFEFALTSSFKPPPMVVTVNMISTVYTQKVWFLPVTKPSNWVLGGGNITSTTTPVAPLPGQTTYPPVEWPEMSTTTYCSNASCQTYILDQIDTLRSAPKPTTQVVTFPIPPTTNGQVTSPIITITMPVQSSGYYWSPKPNPAFPELPWPTFPSLPPIPTPTCLSLFGLIKIDCPPDKSAPTTKFTTGPPTSTCTKSCGTVCTVNCDTTGEAASETDTESECTTSTVTDIFVSCMTGSCTTTKTSLVSGCDILATSTTTEARWCPTGVPFPQDGDDDEGTDIVRGTEIAGMPQNGIVIVADRIYPIFYATETVLQGSPYTGWWWKYFDFDIGLPNELLAPGLPTTIAYTSTIIQAASYAIIVPPIAEATRLAPTGKWLEVSQFNNVRDCVPCVGNACLTRAGGPQQPVCCGDDTCNPKWQMCNCNAEGACAETDPECCFHNAGADC